MCAFLSPASTMLAREPTLSGGSECRQHCATCLALRPRTRASARGRRTATATTAAATKNAPPATAIAACRPPMNEAPAIRVPSTATPRVPPAWRDALSTPAAIRAWWAGHRRPHADRAGALRSIGIGRPQHRQRARHEQRRADPLGDPGPDEEPDRGGGGTRRRRDREQAQAGEEDAPAPEPVAQRAPGEQQRREHQRVGVDHPLQPGDAALQLAPEVGQRNVDGPRRRLPVRRATRPPPLLPALRPRGRRAPRGAGPLRPAGAGALAQAGHSRRGAALRARATTTSPAGWGAR